jgi:hypothetical protein
MTSNFFCSGARVAGYFRNYLPKAGFTTAASGTHNKKSRSEKDPGVEQRRL